MPIIRKWTPRDRKERPRLVELKGLLIERGATVGILVIETDRRLPGVALVSPIELSKAERLIPHEG